MSPELKTVITHLTKLYHRILSVPPSDLSMKRKLLDRYCLADPSCGDFVGEYHPLKLENCEAEWVLAPGADADNRLLYIHGGAWSAGTLEGYRAHVDRISAVTGCAVLSVAYRLAPEHPFPAGLNDCVAAYEWLRENGPQGKSEAKSTFIIGDSAGGNLTLATLLKLKFANKPFPNAAVTLSAATDFTGLGESMASRADVDVVITPDLYPLYEKIYLQGKVSTMNPLASPLFGDLSGLPPLLLQVGDAEVLRDDSVRFAELVKKAGGEVEFSLWPNMPHVFQLFAPFLPEAVQAMDELGAFVKEYSASE